MTATLYSATMSLDGFIAGPGGDMSWLSDHLGPNPLADGLVPQIGSLLIGANTWSGDDPNQGTDQEGAFGGQWHGPQFVLTHHASEEPVEGVTFLTDVPGAVAASKAAAGGKAYVNILGADVARQCLKAGLLDEVLVFVAPVMLGDGTPLFRRTGPQVDLERINVDVTDGATGLWFRVVGSPRDGRRGDLLGHQS